MSTLKAQESSRSPEMAIFGYLLSGYSIPCTAYKCLQGHHVIKLNLIPFQKSQLFAGKDVTVKVGCCRGHKKDSCNSHEKHKSINSAFTYQATLFNDHLHKNYQKNYWDCESSRKL
jgi:hypothetical protein